MQSSEHTNYKPWDGMLTFGNWENYYAPHTKNPYRPSITNTYVEAIALKTDYEKNPRSYLSVGQRIREVYHSCMQFEHPEEQWEFSRVLGYGSFDLACLYQKRDPKDEVVAKSEMPMPELAVHNELPGISKEVFHMTQLNERADSQGHPRLGVVQLRGYKAMSGEMSTQGNGTDAFAPDPDQGFVIQPLYREWRTFMENCSYGTLTRVILTYKAWGYHIPEAFIWWTFLWLIDACKAMEQDPNNEFLQVKSREDIVVLSESFMLSNDIKHDNIFVGDPRPECAPGAPFDTYPAARMGDFGLSRITRFDDNNRISKFPQGTRLWVAPEKRNISMGVDKNARNTYPFYQQERVDEPTWARYGGVPPHTDSHCIGPEANVWSAAMAVYLLMTLEDMRDLDEIVKEKLSHQNETRDNQHADQYLFELGRFNKFLSDDEDYSDELKNLVRECTRIEPLRRPNTDEILSHIHEGIRREYDRLQEEFGDDEEIRAATRMAFTNEDWQKVPMGPFNMMPRSRPGVRGTHRDRRGWRDFYGVVEQWADPEAPTLVPPGQCKIYQPGDTVPVYYTAQNPLPPNPLQRPFYGDDWLLYVDADFMDGYHAGDPLPRGGRARLPPMFI